MLPEFKTEIGNIKLNTLDENNSLTQTTSVSMNEEKVFLSIQYKIFKGYKVDKEGNFLMKTEFGKSDTKIPKYSIFSIDKVYKNSFFGLEEMDKEVPQYNSEEKIKRYFNL